MQYFLIVKTNYWEKRKNVIDYVARILVILNAEQTYFYVVEAQSDEVTSQVPLIYSMKNLPKATQAIKNRKAKDGIFLIALL